MANIVAFRCDGCGQLASPEHVAQRLRRLEWATRYRPVHIRTLLLGATSPTQDSELLYAPCGELGGGQFQGEAGLVLRAVGISPVGREADDVQAEFQAAGFFLAHMLECPVETGVSAMRDSAMPDLVGLLHERLPALASRIRRSLKPKCVILVTEALEPVVQNILALDLGCPVILNGGKPFDFSDSASEQQFSRFRKVLPGTPSR